MSHGRSDQEAIQTTRNASRFFVEQRQIARVLLIFTVLGGIYGYRSMPQRKDPDIPVRRAVALVPWPGNSAERVEQLVTRPVEEAVSQNTYVTEVESVSRTNLSIVYLDLDENLEDTGKQFDDVKMKLEGVQLPAGAGPIQFVKDFGDTAALMLTVASPPLSDQEIDLRAQAIERAIREHRGKSASDPTRFTLVACFPESTDERLLGLTVADFLSFTRERGVASDLSVFGGPGYVAVDGRSKLSDEAILLHLLAFTQERLKLEELHPDLWEAAVIRSPSETRKKLSLVAGDRYSYRELDEITELLADRLRTVPDATKVERAGVLEERIFLVYSQERLASYGMSVAGLADLLGARNIATGGGETQSGGSVVPLTPTGEFRSEKEIGEVAVAQEKGSPVYLRDLVSIDRSYESPASYLNFFTWRDEQGTWHRNRAITLTVQMRPGKKIGDFGREVDEVLAAASRELPSDLIIRRTSDQPLQVTENIDLFMRCLLEAIVLVVLISLVGFWEWRSALVMALAIPITLAMTFLFMAVCGIDLQQVSIAALILALGLLVDDPVVAGDAIKNELGRGHPPAIAAWLGPTRLATAILYATITNIVAYLPFLLLSGDTGRFLYSLPVVITCSLVASRLVSMTFIPLLGYYLLRPSRELPLHERRQHGYARIYYRVARWCVTHRWWVMALSGLLLALGAALFLQLETQFFPKDLQYLSYLELRLPMDRTLVSSNREALKAEQLILEAAGELEARLGRKVLKNLTTFLGGGGPRFWFSVEPELKQLYYAQIIIEVEDKHDTVPLLEAVSARAERAFPGVQVDARQLETGKPIGVPVALRLTGQDLRQLRTAAEQVKSLLRKCPLATRVRDDWGEEGMVLEVVTDSDRANLAGVTHLDVAQSTTAALSGTAVTVLREGDRQIPVVARMRMDERAQLSDLRNLYVYSSQGDQKVRLGQVARVDLKLEPQMVRRRRFARALTVGAFPVAGHLPSEVIRSIEPEIKDLAARLGPGVKLEVAGEQEEQQKSFTELAVVMAISMAGIFLALVFQFKSALKPLLVYAGIPFGFVGAIAALFVMKSPFGFMAFLGIAALVGVIVSHIIVLFDYIEEMQAEGACFTDALLDAGLARLRPVLITVGATVFAMFPLVHSGGPLWEPLCYTQIGGLTVATCVTLLLVPVMYSIFVLDLKILRWEGPLEPETTEEKPTEEKPAEEEPELEADEGQPANPEPEP